MNIFDIYYFAQFVYIFTFNVFSPKRRIFYELIIFPFIDIINMTITYHNYLLFPLNTLHIQDFTGRFQSSALHIQDFFNLSKLKIFLFNDFNIQDVRNAEFSVDYTF